jgi:hypothetical protein
MARHTAQDEGLLSLRMVWGGVLIAVSILGFVAIRRASGGDMLFPHGEGVGGIWWALLALNCGFLGLGLYWTVRGLRVRLQPTTWLYRILDPQRWRELFTRQR